MFERVEVEPDSLYKATKALATERRVALTGSAGTGRSWVAERIGRMLFGPGPVLSLRFGTRPDRSEVVLTQASKQLRTDEPLRALVEHGLTAGIDALARHTGGWTVIADDADAVLRPDDDGWADPEQIGLLHAANERWRRWLSDRPGLTVVVGRRPVGDGWTDIAHRPPARRPIELVGPAERRTDWERLAEILGPRPDRLFLAAALVPVLPSGQLSGLLEDPSSTLVELGRLFRAAFPSRAAALDVIATLGGDPVGVVQDALLTLNEDAVGLLDELQRANLVTIAGGQVDVCAAVRESGAGMTLDPGSAGGLAVSLLAPVNRTDSLDATIAGRVLAVHRLAVLAGDRELALRTCTLHVHGLVELARRESRAGRYTEATRSYAKIRSMLDDGPARTRVDLVRVRSYTLHYHAWNGVRAKTVPLDTAQNESAEAVALWPENARWHGLQIELLLALGRTVDATRALTVAERAVADHPQRARHLRLRPARRALQLGFVRSCLALVEDGPPTWLHDAEAVEVHRVIRRRLDAGVEVPEIAADGTTVVFLRPVRIRMVRLTHHWEASISDLARAEAPSAIEAHDRAVRHLAEQTRTLVTTPTPQLAAADAARKGLLLSVIDVLNSDIGLDHRPDRYVLGRVEGDRFVPVQDDLPQMALDAPPLDADGLWFAHVTVQRDGWPLKVLALVPAGSGRSAAALREALDQLRKG